MAGKSKLEQTKSLTSYYVHLYKQKYGQDPVVNGFKARWNFDTMLNISEQKEIEELLDHYFKTISTNGHTLEWFFYHYEELANAMVIQQRDAAEQQQRREATRKRVEEWRSRFAD